MPAYQLCTQDATFWHPVNVRILCSETVKGENLQGLRFQYHCFLTCCIMQRHCQHPCISSATGKQQDSQYSCFTRLMAHGWVLRLCSCLLQWPVNYHEVVCLQEVANDHELLCLQEVASYHEVVCLQEVANDHELLCLQEVASYHGFVCLQEVARHQTM